MKKVAITFLLLLALIASGCDDEYEVPLGTNQGLPLDPALIGSWEFLDSGKKTSQIDVSRRSASEYAVFFSGGDGTDTGFHFIAYPIKVGTSSMIQLLTTERDSAKTPGKKAYFVMSYNISGTGLELNSLNPRVVDTKLKTGVELRNAFFRNIDNKTLFSALGTFSAANTARAASTERESSIDPTPPATPTKSKPTDTRSTATDARLLSAAENGNLIALKNSLAKGANVNARDTGGDTALIKAVKNNRTAIVKILLAKGAKTDAQNKAGLTAFDYIADASDIEIMRVLEIDRNNREMEILKLCIAASDGNLAAVRSFLAKGVNISAKCGDDVTPLMLVADGGHTAIVKMLLEKGADVNAKDKKGRTAMDFARKQEIVQLLKSYQDAQKAIDWLKDRNNTRIAEIDKEIVELEKKLAEIEEQKKKRKQNDQPSSCSDYSFRVNEFLQTGIVIKRGDRLTFSASGTVVFGLMAGGGGPEGISGFQGYNLISNADIPHGTLLARISQADGYYHIGKGKAITADVDGILELNVNDIDASNNGGKFEVKINICRPR